MNFDDFVNIEKIDQENMIDTIRGLPEQIQSAWAFVTQQQNLDYFQIRQTFIAGLSNHTNLTEILSVMISDNCSEIFFLENNQNLLKGCLGKESLLILIVNDDNADDMTSLLGKGLDNGCQVFLLLGNQALKNNFSHFSVPFWELDDHTLSRTMIGYTTFILYGILFKAGVVPDITIEINKLIGNLEITTRYNDVSVPSALNPAKRLAGQMVGRWLKIVAGGVMLPIANRWSNQINQSAKALCYAEDIFHLIHHSLSGIYNPEGVAWQSMVIFLKSGLNNPKMEMMVDQAKNELMCSGLGTDVYSARGEDQLSQLWTSILFGDFLAYYLAIAYDTDPTPVAFLR